MKKTLPIIFALVVVLALLVGCGPPAVPDKTDPDASKDPGKDPGVGLKAAEITVQVEEGWREYYEAAVKRIKDANPDVTINLQEVGSFTHLDTLSSTDAANPDVRSLRASRGPSDRSRQQRFARRRRCQSDRREARWLG
jgi:arabinogalactan oligomer/maltooligosaccharide transport system substrate-binding protein